ncbi:MAG: DUF5317 family protein [Chloroflexota bacterium]
MQILTVTLGLILLVLTLFFGLAGLRRLATLQFRGGWLAVLAGVSQILNVLIQQYRVPLLIATIVFLGAFCILNYRLPGLILITVGVAMNLAAMAANGGMMPVQLEQLERAAGVPVADGTVLDNSKGIALTDESANLPWFGDRLLLPGPLAQLAVWSVGDILLIWGVIRLLWVTMKGPRTAPQVAETASS